jgi:hypothetical protein
MIRTEKNDLHVAGASVGTSCQLALEIGQRLGRCGDDVWRSVVNGERSGFIEDGSSSCELAGGKDLADAARWSHDGVVGSGNTLMGEA